ncbi:MAG: MFS transporter [Bacteroidota bacterium]|jgi:MFS family permease
MFVIWRHRRENPVLFPITLGFSILSVGFGNWIGRIPETKRLLGLSESDLGLCFFGMATGAFLGAQIAATLCEKWKPAIVISVSCWLLCLGIILIPFANSQLSLTSILFFMGTANSWLNVSMNAAASQMENKLKTPILSTCHGMYSLGGVVGITSSGLFATAEIPLTVHLPAVGIFIALYVAYVYRFFLVLVPLPRQMNKKKFSLPEPWLLKLMIIGLIVMVCEGAVTDWSTLYLRDELNAPIMWSTLGYAGFSFSMAGGRFLGDYIRKHFHPIQLVRYGILIGSIGLFIAASFPFTPGVIAGFSLTGIGFSIIVPLLFVISAMQKPENPTIGIAGIATSGVIGFLMGPPLIGMVGELFSLSAAFNGLGVFAFLAAVIAWKKD